VDRRKPLPLGRAVGKGGGGPAEAPRWAAKKENRTEAFPGDHPEDLSILNLSQYKTGTLAMARKIGLVE